jgi:tRNA 2-thiouridine synthesizing protein E
MSDIMKYIIDDVELETDFNGFLVNRDDWSEAVATALANREGIELTSDHWEVINFLRHHYQEYGKTPNVRSLIKMFAKTYGADKANKERLYDLFPDGPSQQGCKIAGLPLPQDCIDLK